MEDEEESLFLPRLANFKPFGFHALSVLNAISQAL